MKLTVSLLRQFNSLRKYLFNSQKSSSFQSFHHWLGIATLLNLCTKQREKDKRSILACRIFGAVFLRGENIFRNIFLVDRLLESCSTEMTSPLYFVPVKKRVPSVASILRFSANNPGILVTGYSCNKGKLSCKFAFQPALDKNTRYPYIDLSTSKVSLARVWACNTGVGNFRWTEKFQRLHNRNSIYSWLSITRTSRWFKLSSVSLQATFLLIYSRILDSR